MESTLPRAHRRTRLSLSPGQRRAIKPEERDIVPGGAFAAREVGHDLANHTAELIAMTRARRRQDHLTVLRVVADDKVAVRRIGEEAAPKSHGGSAPLGKIALPELPQHALVC